MLVKKELETIPVQPYPKKLKKKNSLYVAAVCTNDLKRSGKVLVVDIFSTNYEKLYIRFFSDGKTYLICQEWPVNKWKKNTPERFLDSFTSVEATDKDSETAYSLLINGIGNYWCNKYSIREVITAFAYKVNSRKREQAQDNKYALMNQHFDMFPEYPADLREFCETNVFGHTYIFVSKCIKNKRQAVCGHCGHKYEVDKSLKPGTNASCPKCDMNGAVKGDWTGGSYEEKAEICIAQKYNDQLLIRWTKVKRKFINCERNYNFEDFYRNLYLVTKKGKIIYAYQYQTTGFYGWQWYRKRNNEVYYGRSFVYTNNMREIFGGTYYNVDLQSALKNAGEISFTHLLDNLKNIPATEYLVKMKLTALAAGISKNDIDDKQGFTGVLGVSKQYLPMYQKYNVNITEHNIIKASRTWVSEKNFERLKELHPESWFTSDITDLLETMSFEKLVNYFTKQAQLLNKSFKDLITLYKDYISMSKSLYVDMDRKSVRFPDNIKESHDLLRTRYNEIKIQVEEEKYKQAIEKISAGMKEFADKDFCMVLPTTRNDFIKEGQSLNHCVGNESYFNSHIKGTRMIFFIRKLSEPEKPYYTMEVDMNLLKILQLYGFGDCSATPDVRKFANSFIRKLQPNSQEERKAS